MCKGEHKYSNVVVGNGIVKIVLPNSYENARNASAGSLGGGYGKVIQEALNFQFFKRNVIFPTEEEKVRIKKSFRSLASRSQKGAANRRAGVYSRAR